MAQDFDIELTQLDYKSLYALADWHERQALKLKSRAQKLQSREHESQVLDQRLEYIQRSYKAVMRFLKQGNSLQESLSLAANNSDLPLRTVQKIWGDFITSKQANAIKERNTLIYELHGLGLTNVIIAERLNLHAVSISRILKKEKQKRIYNPDPKKISRFSNEKKKGGNSQKPPIKFKLI